MPEFCRVGVPAPAVPLGKSVGEYTHPTPVARRCLEQEIKRMPFQMVLTASVNPKGMYVKVADSQIRLQQYLRAVTALLETANSIVDGITLIENTGADLSPFHDLAAKNNKYGKKVEFLGLNLNDYPLEYGIGYGEFRLLDAGIQQSKLIGPETSLVKLTGRLIVRNLVSILSRIPTGMDMVADMKAYKDPSDGWVESRLMVISQSFYMSKMIGMYQQVNGAKGVAAEHCLYQVVRKSPGAKIIPRLPREPQWVGYSGSTGMRYDSLSMRLRHPPRIMRRVWRQLLNQPNLETVWKTNNTSDGASRYSPLFPPPGVPGGGLG